VLINGRTLAFEKVPESPREVWAQDGSRMTRDFVVAGDSTSRIEAALDFLGGPQLVPVFTGGTVRYYISRTLPHAYPARVSDGTGDFFLFAQSIPDGRPLGVGAAAADGSGGLTAEYTNYLMTVEYRTLSYDLKDDDEVLAGEPLGENLSPLNGFPDEGYALAAAPEYGLAALAATDLPLTASRFVTRMARPGGRSLVLRQGMMRYVTDGKPVPEGIPVNVPFTTLSYTWHQVPDGGLPLKAISAALGTLNNAAFDGYAAQTLLLTNAVPRPYRNPFGERNYDVESTFRYQPNVSYLDGTSPLGQNCFLRVVGGSLNWDYATANGDPDGQPAYRVTDFAALFRPDQG
jgi:hypothetical protein